MPRRNLSFITDETYHVFNKTIEGKKIFALDHDCNQFNQIVQYYRSSKASIRFSMLRKLEAKVQKKIMNEVSLRKYLLVDILAYCLMPTHFHFLLKQLVNNGLVKFISNTLNSFTRYHNLKNNRTGPLFLPRFKAVRIMSEEQLIHTSRYIHLNPYSNGIVDKTANLISYSWSSFKEYLSLNPNNFSNPDYILNVFGNKRNNYKEFVLSNAEHQKTLEQVKHVEKWI